MLQRTGWLRPPDLHRSLRFPDARGSHEEHTAVRDRGIAAVAADRAGGGIEADLKTFSAFAAAVYRCIIFPPYRPRMPQDDAILRFRLAAHGAPACGDRRAAVQHRAG